MNLFAIDFVALTITQNVVHSSFPSFSSKEAEVDTIREGKDDADVQDSFPLPISLTIMEVSKESIPIAIGCGVNKRGEWVNGSFDPGGAMSIDDPCAWIIVHALLSLNRKLHSHHATCVEL
ncbi:hypothetical protein RJT34_00860 [Clitoria ternatea]|uniref:Uncharacterized protein n=1 Tax=Clitoria ternatea TaxID=43366 RepID=A0AAN9KGI2_CLITE